MKFSMDSTQNLALLTSLFMGLASPSYAMDPRLTSPLVEKEGKPSSVFITIDMDIVKTDEKNATRVIYEAIENYTKTSEGKRALQAGLIVSVPSKGPGSANHHKLVQGRDSLDAMNMPKTTDYGLLAFIGNNGVSTGREKSVVGILYRALRAYRSPVIHTTGTQVELKGSQSRNVSCNEVTERSVTTTSCQFTGFFGAFD